jgi:hypothetical protein
MQRIGQREERHVTTLSALVTIVMVVLLLLSTALVLVSVARADIEGRNFTREGGTVIYVGKLRNESAADGYDTEPNKILVFEGEKIYFKNKLLPGEEDIIVTGPYDGDGDTQSGIKDYPRIEAGKPWYCSEDDDYFQVTEADNRSIGGWFGVSDHSFTLELEKEEIQEREHFNLTLKKNDKMGGVMKLTIKDEDEFLITNVSGTYINEIPIRYDNETDFSGYDEHEPVGISFENGTLVFDTTELNMKEGEYTIILEDFATEVEKDVDIKVKKIFLDVEFEDEVVKGDDIVIKITSSFYEEKVDVTVGDFYHGTSLPLDEGGKVKVTIPTGTEDVECGKHKVTVKVCGKSEEETKYVTVKKGEASLEELPEDATVGDIITLKGTSNFGDFAVFVIDDVFKGKARITDEEFEWDWDTVGEFDEFRNVEVFIVNESFSEEFVNEDWQREEGVDMSAGIFLLLPVFSMTVPVNVAEEDEVVISGSAAGTDGVYVIVLNYKGEVMFPANGLATATPVEEGKWEETIGELDSGRYTVISVHKGKDDTTETIKEGTWAVGGEGKTLKQRVALLDDAISTAGSDDMYEKAYFIVSAPTVSLKALEAVEIGDAIIVKAETNIRNGERVFVSLSQSPGIIDKTTVVVDNGSVSASINTSGLLPGNYNLTVDVSGRASDEMEVILVEKEVVEEDSEAETANNESVTVPEDVGEANESVGNESREGVGGILPVNVHDLLIAVVTAIFISLFVKRRQRGYSK